MNKKSLTLKEYFVSISLILLGSLLLFSGAILEILNSPAKDSSFLGIVSGLLGAYCFIKMIKYVDVKKAQKNQ